MESGRIFFDPSCHGNLLFLSNGDSHFRGTRSGINMEEKKGLFFSSPEKLYDDEYFDEQFPEKKRRLTPEQVHLLEKSFEAENKLEPERKTQLATNLGLQPRQVAVWFQNRRARCKTKQLERDYDALKASFDSLRSSYDFILKENEKLKAELLSLTEKSGPAKEPNGEPPVVGPLLQSLQVTGKAEDRLSAGSDGSAVVDEDGRQLLDSGDSYFPAGDYSGCMAPMADGGDGRSYFSDVFAAAEQQEPMGWCIWS